MPFMDGGDEATPGGRDMAKRPKVVRDGDEILAEEVRYRVWRFLPVGTLGRKDTSFANFTSPYHVVSLVA